MIGRPPISTLFPSATLSRSFRMRRRDDGRRDLEAGRELVPHPRESVRARRLHDERYVDLLVVERRPVPPAAVLAELLAVVRGQDEERPVVEPAALQVVEEHAQVL